MKKRATILSLRSNFSSSSCHENLCLHSRDPSFLPPLLQAHKSPTISAPPPLSIAPTSPKPSPSALVMQRPGGQVSQLQRFLSDYYDLNPDDYVTGYFGRLTKANVQKFQCEQNIACSGNEATTGWGVVGPRTRAAIQRVCGTQTTPPPPPTQPPPANPPPPPQCTPDAPQTQTLLCTAGQTGSIIQIRTSTCPGPTWGPWATMANTCTSVNTDTSSSASCIFNNQTISHGASVTAYQAASVPNGQQCVSETRTCTNGTLSGSYTNATCTVQPPPNNASCTLDGVTVAHGASQTFYSASTVTSPNTCVAISQTRTCNNGTLSGSSTYNKASCSVTTPPPPPTGQATLTATPSSGAAPLTVSLLATVHNVSGRPSFDYGDGSALQLACLGSGNFDTFGWGGCPGHTYTAAGTYTAKLTLNGSTLATATITVTASQTSGQDFLAVSPGSFSSGPAPLSVVLYAHTYGAFHPMMFDFGDGSAPGRVGGIGACLSDDFGVFCNQISIPHVYTTPGTYIAKVMVNGVVLATLTITVTGSTTSASQTSPSQSQLAAVLVALESALKALLQLLK